MNTFNVDVPNVGVVVISDLEMNGDVISMSYSYEKIENKSDDNDELVEEYVSLWIIDALEKSLESSLLLNQS